MKNPISYLYQKTDNAIMYCVNKGVKAWNWTTGQTKADLANQLLTVAPIFEGTGFFTQDRFVGAICTSVFLMASHIDQKRNKRQEKEEEKASGNSARLNPNKGYENYSKLFGPSYTAVGIINLTEKNLGNIVLGVGLSLRASSHYVMRADYFPPQKSIFRKVKDKLVEKIKSSSHAPIPENGLVPVKYKTLEDYLIK